MKNIIDLLTKGLSRELVHNSSNGMGLKSLKYEKCNDSNHT